MGLISLLLLAGAALSDPIAEVDSLKTCGDTPEPGGVDWINARTVRVEGSRGGGSGVVVSPDGYLLTAAHVVAASGKLEAVFEDGGRAPAQVIRTSSETDLALLRVELEGLACIPVATERAKAGSNVLVVGSPGGEALSHSVSKGIVSAWREVEGVVLLQTDASINRGNSGGPIVGEDGRLLGVVSFKMSGDGVEGLGFAVAAENMPEALSVRWGDATSPALAEARPDTSQSRFLAGASVEPGPNVIIDTSTTYTLGYRPRPGSILLGAAVAVGGWYLASSTYGSYDNALNNNETLQDFEWTWLRTRNATGWILMASGALLVGKGFLPSPYGPVTPELEAAP